MDSIKSFEIDVTPIQYVKAVNLIRNSIKNIDPQKIGFMGVVGNSFSDQFQVDEPGAFPAYSFIVV